MFPMPTRGPYAKGVAKRAAILEAALEIISQNGYSGATVKELADAVGLSQNGVLHYFGSKDELFVEILRRRDELDAAERIADAGSDPDPAAAVVSLVAHNVDVPGFVQLYARLSNEAAEASHVAHPYFRDRYEAIRRDGRFFFEQLQRDGKVRDDLDPAELAAQLFALIDGLQTQWIYDPDAVDMPRLVASFFRTIAPLAHS